MMTICDLKAALVNAGAPQEAVRIAVEAVEDARRREEDRRSKQRTRHANYMRRKAEKEGMK